MAGMDVQHGRRRDSSKTESSAEQVGTMTQPADLRKVAVVPKVNWLRIQDRLNNVNKDEERIREAAKQREALHLKSKEMAKLWPNTLAMQKQKRLEAKKMREETEEEERILIDIEEAEYQEQKRNKAIGKAKAQLFYQTDRVRGLHSALLLAEVLKEREAQVELKQKMQSSSKDVDKEFVDMMKSREDEALRQEEEKGLQKRLEKLAAVEDLKKQIKDNELKREQQKLEDQKEGEEIQQRLQIYLQQQRMEDEKQVQQRRILMQDHLENIANRDTMKAAEKQKQEQEEEQRKVILAAKEKMLKLRKDKETELLREAQMIRERMAEKLSVRQQAQAVSEEERIAQAVAERDAKEAHKQNVKEEKKAAVMKSIAAHREAVIQEKKQMDRIAQQNEQDTAQARKEADRIFSEKQKLKDEKIRKDGKASLDFCVIQVAEKSARDQHWRRAECEFTAKNVDLLAEEERVFQLYSRQVIEAAADAERNTFPLCKAAKEGIGGGLGPIIGGAMPSYLVQDDIGADMPGYVSGTTQNIEELNKTADIKELDKTADIKELNKTADIQKPKKQVRFTL